MSLLGVGSFDTKMISSGTNPGYMRVWGNSSGVNRKPAEGAISSVVLGNADVPKQYLVVITDEKPKAYTDAIGAPNVVIIKAPLQEKITTRTESTWSPLFTGSYVRTLFANLTQWATGRAMVSQYFSRRIWTGGTPLDFTLNLKFQSVNNTEMEVLYPVIELQKMALPFSGISNKSGKFSQFVSRSFLAPPGPDPFAGAKPSDLLALFGSREAGKSTRDKHENITIEIGTFMMIKRAVVKDITIQQSPKFTVQGHPIEAVASVHFQTFEIITKEGLDDIYQITNKPVAPDTPSKQTMYGVGSTGTMRA